MLVWTIKTKNKMIVETDVTLEATKKELNDTKVILKKHERQSEYILVVGKSELGQNALGHKPPSPMNFVKSN